MNIDALVSLHQLDTDTYTDAQPRVTTSQFDSFSRYRCMTVHGDGDEPLSEQNTL